METREQYPITLVTAWYKIRRRGESSFRPYEEWMRNLLSHIRWPLVVFGEEQSLDEMRRMRGDRPAVYLAVSPEEFLAHRYWSVFQDQCTDRPDRSSSLDPNLAMVWNEKCNFARRAAGMNPFKSEMIFWCDAGAFKATASYNEQVFRLSGRIEWPNLQVCRALPQDKVAIPVVNYPDLPPGFSGPPPGNAVPDDGQPALAVNAGFWGGSREAVIRWGDAYYECLERRFREGRFILVEEPIMGEVCITRPELVHLIPRSAVSWGGAAGETSWTHYRWYYLNGGKFPLGYLCREVLPRIGDWGFIKWLVLILWRGAFRFNWKALWPFGGGGSGGGNGRGRAA